MVLPKRLCVGCFSKLGNVDKSPCTKFVSKTREELIEMFNAMLEHYEHEPIKEKE